MATDLRSNRDRKVDENPITIRPLDRDIWQILDIYLLELNQKNSKEHLPRLTKAELIEKILMDFLKEKSDNNELELGNKELIKKIKEHQISKKNK